MSSGVVEIRVSAPPQEPSINIIPPSPISGLVGEEKQLMAIWDPPVNQYDAHWTVDRPDIVEISPLVGDATVATFLSTGTAHVTATPKKKPVDPTNPAIEEWKRIFLEHEPRHWDFWQQLEASGGIGGDEALWLNYYDRAWCYYKAAELFDDPQYLVKGDWHAKTYLEGYVLPNNGQVSPRGSNIESFPQYLSRTNDIRAYEMALHIAELAWTNWWPAMPHSQYYDGRIAARTLEAMIVAAQLSGTEPWKARAQSVVEGIIYWQRASGKFEMNASCGGSLNYTVGMIGQALTRYEAQFGQDMRVPAIIANASAWLLDNEWWPVIDPANPMAIFRYQDIKCADGAAAPANSPGLHLNGLFISLFTHPNIPTSQRDYFTKVVSGGNQHSWVDGYGIAGTKQFTQFFRMIDGFAK